MSINYLLYYISKINNIVFYMRSLMNWVRTQRGLVQITNKGCIHRNESLLAIQ